MPLSEPVLRQSLFAMIAAPSSSVGEAAVRFASAIESWASSAMAMGVLPILPVGVVASGVLAGEPIPSVIERFWASVVFPGASSPPVGPPVPNVMTVLSGDAGEAAARLSLALQLNALSRVVTFVVGGVPTPFPVL